VNGSTGNDQQADEEPDAAAGEDRREALARAAEIIRSGKLEVISPEELAELRRPRNAE
jgi:hypothetical protein